MEILRTIVRFGIILILIALLVFLSITLFKLIPIGINHLANSGNNADKAATTTPETINSTSTATSTIIISEPVSEPVKTVGVPTPVVNTVYKPQIITRTVYYPQTQPVLTGNKNIKVQLIGLGVINRSTGQFISTNSFNIGDTVSVKYNVSNTGDTATGPFNMRVEMPTSNSFDSVKQISGINIAGFNSYNVEARFDGLNSYNPVVRIYTDIDNQVFETNENDNILNVPINVVNNIPNNNNCYYYNNCNNNFSPNLIISSIETGRIINGYFSPQTSFPYGQPVAIRFIVKNIGGNILNTWSTRTTYTDMYGSQRVFTTNNERALANNETVAIIVDGNNLNRGNTIFNIHIDSNNNVYESNENDNFSSVNIYTY